MPALDDDDVPSCSLWPFGRRRRDRLGWAPLADEHSYRDEKAPLVPEPDFAPAYEPIERTPPPLPPRPVPVPFPTPAMDAYETLRPLQPGHTGRSHASSVSEGSVKTSTTSEYMSLDADPFDDPESPARVAYLNARLSSLQHYQSGGPVDPRPPIQQPLSLLDIQDPKSRAPVRVAATLGDVKMASLGHEERRLQRARAEADAWKHEANLVYHQLCSARILALERMYERNAWRERCEAVEEEVARRREAHR